MSIETILNVCVRACTHTHTHTHTLTHTHAHTHTHTHTGTCTHEHTDNTKLNLHSLKQAANTDLRWMKTAAQNRKHGRTIGLGKRNVRHTILPFFPAVVFCSQG